MYIIMFVCTFTVTITYHDSSLGFKYCDFMVQCIHYSTAIRNLATMGTCSKVHKLTNFHPHS